MLFVAKQSVVIKMTSKAQSQGSLDDTIRPEMSWKLCVSLCISFVSPNPNVINMKDDYIWSGKRPPTTFFKCLQFGSWSHERVWWRCVGACNWIINMSGNTKFCRLAGLRLLFCMFKVSQWKRSEVGRGEVTTKKRQQTERLCNSCSWSCLLLFTKFIMSELNSLWGERSIRKLRIQAHQSNDSQAGGSVERK